MVYHFQSFSTLFFLASLGAMIFYASNLYFYCFKKVGYLIRKETEGGRRYTFSQYMNEFEDSFNVSATLRTHQYQLFTNQYQDVQWICYHTWEPIV